MFILLFNSHRTNSDHSFPNSLFSGLFCCYNIPTDSESTTEKYTGYIITSKEPKEPRYFHSIKLVVIFFSIQRCIQFMGGGMRSYGELRKSPKLAKYDE